MIQKTTIFTLCLTVFTLYANAQDTYVGLRTGYHLSSFQASKENAGAVGLKPKNALDIALVITQKTDDAFFGYSFEPGYMLKGSRVGRDDLDYRLHYLSMPVLVDFYPIERLRISVGPELAYLAGARNEVNDTLTVSMSNRYDKRWEVSGIIGASIAPTYFMELGVRYNLAFTKASGYDAVIERRNIYNRYLQFFVIWKLWN